MISSSHTSLIAGLLSVFLVASCLPQVSAPPSPAAVVTPEVSATADVVSTPPSSLVTGESEPDEVSSPESPLPVELILWTVEPVSPQAEGKPGEIFGKGLRAFENTYPDVPVSVVLKNESGKGSVLDYLRTASQAAPSILPDVVVLNTVDLYQVARAGLTVPLDGLISPDLVDDLLPAARAVGTVDGQLMGIPFELDIEHLIYNTNKVSAAPLVWTDIISAGTPYVFPAKGRNGLVNDAFLIQYLALGGQFQDEEGQPFLDEQAVQAILEYYRQGVEEGIIPADVLTIGDPSEIWSNYVSAQVGIAHVNSHRFLSDRDVLSSTQFGTIPTRDGTPLTIARGRALAVVARDPNRRAVAANLIEWLMSSDNNAAWNRATSYLPTRYAAFELIGDSDPYWPFLQHQLEVAVPPPVFPEYDQIGRVLQQAVIEVLSEEATPEEATTAAEHAIMP